MQPIPNFAWYSQQSKAAGVSPRCPLASSELCPRYYASTWLLADAGFTTRISPAEVQRLDRKWEPFRPTISEEEPSVTNPGSERLSVQGFCPEVSYERFHQFAAQLGSAGDEFDVQFRHQSLSQQLVSTEDPRWRWGSYTERHFTECREYSIFNTSGPLTLRAKKGSIARQRQSMGPKLRWLVFARDTFTCTYCGRRPPEVPLEVDHRTAVANGGTNELENLVTSCQDCNRGKGVEEIQV